MRVGLIAGIILIVLGGIVLLPGASYLTTHDVVKVGDVHITDTDSNRIPQWVGIAGIVAGLGVIGVRTARRTA